MVNAQQSRRILDRIVGYEVSPVLWRKVKTGLSAGRVQSVAVKLVVEREREILAFQPEESWKILAHCESGNINFPIEFAKIGGKGKKLKTMDDARVFFSTLGISLDGIEPTKDKKGNLVLSLPVPSTFTLLSAEKKDSVRLPGAPFTTSTLQQEASRKLGFSVKSTMDIAQQLYQEGFITYMRTDSVNLSDLAIGTAKKYITDTFGAQYALPNGRRYKTKQANAQEAHEAIRPTDITRPPNSMNLDGPKLKLYSLIWERTVASQMKEALIETTTFVFSPDLAEDQQWITKGEVIRFPGFMQLYIEGSDTEDEDDENVKLPPLSEGDRVSSKSFSGLQKFTQPPSRYTEAMLIKRLEAEGIGRPATYAPTISTIMDRGYIEKDGKKLKPSDIAFVVTDFLEEHFNTFMQYGFTAEVEEEFDQVSRGELAWQLMLQEFYDPFHAMVVHALGNAERATGERILGKDPKTGKTVLVRMARFGPVVQIGTPDEVPEGEKPQYANLPPNESLETIKIETALTLFGLPKTIGTYEGADVIVGMGRFGPYVKFGDSYVSIPRGEDPMSVDMDRAVALMEAKKQEDAPVCFYETEPVTKGKGRFGPFIKWKSLYVNVPRTLDFENLTEAECAKLIQAKVEKEASKFIRQWEAEGIAIENGRYGPFIRFKKKPIALKKGGKNLTMEAIEQLTLEEVKAVILAADPDAFGKVAKASKTAAKSTDKASDGKTAKKPAAKTAAKKPAKKAE